MGTDSIPRPEMADHEDVYSFDDYLDRFRKVALRLPASTTEDPGWLESAARLCRLSRSLTHAALRENVTDPIRLTATTSALDAAAHALGHFFDESGDEDVRHYRDHIAARVALFRTRLQSCACAPEG
jgi:hypothetical protein